MRVDYSELPESLREPMRAWIEDGTLPTDEALVLVLIYAPSSALIVPDHLVINVMDWLEEFAPSECWGSREAVDEWPTLVAQRKAQDASTEERWCRYAASRNLGDGGAGDGGASDTNSVEW